MEEWPLCLVCTCNMLHLHKLSAFVAKSSKYPGRQPNVESNLSECLANIGQTSESCQVKVMCAKIKNVINSVVIAKQLCYQSSVHLYPKKQSHTQLIKGNLCCL